MKILDWLFGTVESEYERRKANAVKFMLKEPSYKEFIQYYASADLDFFGQSPKELAYDRGTLETLRQYFIRYPELDGIEDI